MIEIKKNLGSLMNEKGIKMKNILKKENKSKARIFKKIIEYLLFTVMKGYEGIISRTENYENE